MTTMPKVVSVRAGGRENVELIGGEMLFNVHPAQGCAPPCAIHAPSDHHMVEWTQRWAAGKGLYRICRHDQPHPDPDSHSAKFEHDCDGCCTDPTGGLSLDEIVDDLVDMIEELS